MKRGNDKERERAANSIVIFPATYLLWNCGGSLEDDRLIGNSEKLLSLSFNSSRWGLETRQLKVSGSARATFFVLCAFNHPQAFIPIHICIYHIHIFQKCFRKQENTFREKCVPFIPIIKNELTVNLQLYQMQIFYICSKHLFGL